MVMLQAEMLEPLHMGACMLADLPPVAEVVARAVEIFLRAFGPATPSSMT
jgi:hypothetical protein